MLLLLAYNSIFGDITVSNRESSYSFNIYLIIFPLITYIPIEMILTKLVEDST